MFHRRNSYQIVTAFTFLLLVSLACGTTRTEKLKDAVSLIPTETELELEEIEPEATEEVIEEDKEQTEPIPTNTTKPTKSPSTPTPEPEPISVTIMGFGQDGQSAGYAFIVDNPNKSLAFESSQYQIAFYDKDGLVVATDSGYINLLLPGQQIGIGGDLYLDEGITIDSMDVQLNAGNIEVTEPIQTFTVDSVSYFPSEYFSFVSGVINSPYNEILKDIKVNAVIYDDAGNIIGGGYTYLNFVQANSSSGVEVSVTSTENVESVELYPVVSSLSFLDIGADIPADASNISILKSGFGQNEQSVGYGILIENPNQGYSLENSQFQVTAYSADGQVLKVDEGYVDLVLPGQTLGIGGDLYLNEGMVIDHFDAQVIPGEFKETEETHIFTYENVVFQAGSYSSKVTGIILSPYSSDITFVRVSAITYDENGAINGGGYTYLDFVPANSKSAVEVTVTSTGTPIQVELYATVSGLSEVE